VHPKRHGAGDEGEGDGPGDFVKNRLKVLRAERDWSQAELGARLGVSRQAVNAIETGKYDPSLPLAFKLSRLFNLPIEEIFHDDVEGGSDA
jgi:putative transcriptional regulator